MTNTHTRSVRVDALFSETAAISRYLAVEVALAESEADLGIIPGDAARAIAARARVENIDLARYRRDFETVGFPIVGLVRQLTELVPDRHGEYVHWGATTQDIMLLAQTEVDEVQEPAAAGRGVSSAMPHKRNPVLSQQVNVAARLTRAQVAGMLEVMVQDHERGSAIWLTEWTLVPDAVAYGLGALERMLKLLDGLRIDTERMYENLGITNQLVYAEAIMMALAPHLGRQKAHDLVDAAVEETISGKPFLDALQQSAEINDVLSTSDLKRIISGQAHIEAADHAVKEALAHHRSRHLSPPD